ncbi:MAG: hypothetical protein MUC35_04200 [Candidatus Margulisbacteria bacterium]|jgi:lipopolysaccharide export system protein LptA|nr:hypothetical protein [Candidatus Margulisiibacteriota bacterium]
MNNFWKITLTILLAGFIIWLLYWTLFAPKQDLTQLIYSTMQEQSKRADLSFKKVSFEEVVGSEKFWQLEASTAMVNNNTGVATLQDTSGTFYKKGRPVLKFRSPAALWEMKKQEIYLDKPLGYDASLERQITALIRNFQSDPRSLFSLPAQYRRGAGYWFKARNLSWKVADQLLLCTGGIHLTKGEISGRAERLLGDVEFNLVKLDGDPSFQIATASKAPVTIEARSFLIASAKELLSAEGSPTITWQTARITAHSAQYHQGEKLLRLTGDVSVSYEDIRASGAAADYLVAQQQIILTGTARASQGGSNLTSDRVIVSLKEQRIALAGRSRVVVTEEELSQ